MSKVIKTLIQEIDTITLDACEALKAGIKNSEAWAIKMYFSQIFPKVFKNEDMSTVDMTGIDMTIRDNNDIDRICAEISKRIALSADGKMTINNSMEVVRLLKSMRKEAEEQVDIVDEEVSSLTEDQLRAMNLIYKAGKNYRYTDDFN